MREECENMPGEICKYGARFELLEKRVADLEKEAGEQSDFRKTYYQDREARIKRDTELDFKIGTMDGKLDKLLSWKDEQQNRPNKLLDGLKEKFLYSIIGVLATGLIGAVVWLILKMNGGG